MSIHTGARIDSDLELECDVCIVGSGAGGAVVAQRLATAGKRVIVLEDGGFHTSDTFDLTERNMFARLYQERGARATVDQSMAILQGRAVGGTTVVNWTTCFRTPERVMQHWAEHHGVTGLTHEALVPHWERIEQRLNVVQMRLDQVNRNNRLTWEGLGALGWHQGLLSRNVKNCAHTGYCGVGCVIDAKQSMLVTFIPEAVAAGAEVYANAWVERIETSGRTCSAVVARVRDARDRLGAHTITVRPHVTVLSGGAINTPAILLRSGIDPSGRTGKRTFLHPALGAVGVHAQRVDPFVGSPQYVYSDQFVARSDGMSFLIEGGPMFPMTMGSFGMTLGMERQATMELLPYSSLTAALLHDGFDLADPDEGATVTLGEGGRPVVAYKWTDRLREGLRAALEACLEIQLAAGAHQVTTAHPFYATTRDEMQRRVREAQFEPGRYPIFVAHVMGGCAMGTDPHTSVVDSTTMRHHAFDDVFVVDGSVYPTSLTVNPQISIYGLASWASEHIAQAVG